MSSTFYEANDYLSSLPKTTPLSAEQEKALARRIRDHNDASAEQQLITAHLRFVVYIARGYSGYGMSLDDLIQEGNIGLTKAVRRFDPEQGFRLLSYASHAIRSEIHEFVLRNWRIVKVATTNDQRKLFFKLRSSKKQLGWLSDSEASELAKELNVDLDSIKEMEYRMAGADDSFDSFTSDSADSYRLSPADTLHDHADEPSQWLEKKVELSSSLQDLFKGLESLDKQSSQILKALWLSSNKTSLQAIGEKYGVTAAHIRELEKKTIKKLRLQRAAQEGIAC